MKDYKKEVRQRALANAGIFLKPEEIAGADFDTLDTMIGIEAMKHLSKREGQVFYVLWSCTESWEDIQMHLFAFNKLELPLETVQRYARNAAKTAVAKSTSPVAAFFRNRKLRVI